MFSKALGKLAGAAVSTAMSVASTAATVSIAAVNAGASMLDESLMSTDSTTYYRAPENLTSANRDLTPEMSFAGSFTELGVQEIFKVLVNNVESELF